MKTILAANRKVDHVAIFFPNLCGGGAERVMMDLARGFVQQGVNVDMVLANAKGPYLREVHKGVRVVDLGTNRVFYSLPKLVHYMRSERPTAMISTLNHANIIAIWARRIAGVPIHLAIRQANTATISTVNASKIRERLMPFLMRLFYPWADVIIANSNGVAEDLIERIGIPAEKVRVIYNPVLTTDMAEKAEETLDHPWFSPGQPPVILGAGRLTKQKDFPTLIHAVALVRHKLAVRLMILGEGEERSRLKAIVKELGMEQDTELPGFVVNPYKFMKHASIFVLSSRWEGLPNALIQALALGIRVVSTDCPSGPAEILDGGKWGRLVPISDPKSLASAIMAALNDEAGLDSSEQMSKFGLYPVVQEYLNVLGIDKGNQ
jgi:glycosyltransferase involved in cell wall biosynthesis